MPLLAVTLPRSPKTMRLRLASQTLAIMITVPRLTQRLLHARGQCSSYPLDWMRLLAALSQGGSERHPMMYIIIGSSSSLLLLLLRRVVLYGG